MGFVYKGQLRGPLTLTRFAERLVSTSNTKVCRGWGSNTQPSAWFFLIYNKVKLYYAVVEKILIF